MLLSEIAKGYDDDGGEDFSHCGVEVTLFDKELYENIVHPKTDADQQKIPEQLHATLQGRLWKNDILVEQVPGGEADAESNHHR